MSHAVRPRPTSMTVCDLCNQEITAEHRDGGYEHASLLHGQGGNHRPQARSRQVKLWWSPKTWPGSRRGKYSGQVDRNGKSVEAPRSYDFHGRCILLLVEENLNCYSNDSQQEADQ